MEQTPIRIKANQFGLDYKNVFYVLFNPFFKGEKIQALVYNSRFPASHITRQDIRSMNMLRIVQLSGRKNKTFTIKKFEHVDFYVQEVENGLLLLIDLAGDNFSRSNVSDFI